MIKSIEGVRGIAALLVALYHLKIGSEHFSLIRNGYLFVDLFFVLSGFVIAATYGNAIRNAADLRYFIVRRIGRLFPLLAFSTIIFVLGSNAIILAKKLAISSGHAGMLNNPGALEYLVPSVGEILATLTFTHALGIFDHLILNTPTWSISVEFYTYILFVTVCMILAGGARIVMLTLLSIAGLIISVWASVNVHNCIAEKGCLSLTYDFGLARSIHAFCLGTLAFHSSRILKINVTASTDHRIVHALHAACTGGPCLGRGIRVSHRICGDGAEPGERQRSARGRAQAWVVSGARPAVVLDLPDAHAAFAGVRKFHQACDGACREHDHPCRLCDRAVLHFWLDLSVRGKSFARAFQQAGYPRAGSRKPRERMMHTILRFGLASIALGASVVAHGAQVIEYYGDSTIWGYQSQNGERVAKPAPAVFAESLPNPGRFEVRNEGVNGSTACELLNGTDGRHGPWSEQMAKSKARYVLVNFAINDQWKHDLDSYAACLRALARVARTHGKQMIFETPNPTRDSGPDSLDVYVDTMRKVALEERVPVIDQYRYLTDRLGGQSPLTLCPDGLHPSDAVYVLKGRFAAKMFAKYFLER